MTAHAALLDIVRRHDEDSRGFCSWCSATAQRDVPWPCMDHQVASDALFGVGVSS